MYEAKWKRVLVDEKKRGQRRRMNFQPQTFSTVACNTFGKQSKCWAHQKAFSSRAICFQMHCVLVMYWTANNANNKRMSWKKMVTMENCQSYLHLHRFFILLARRTVHRSKELKCTIHIHKRGRTNIFSHLKFSLGFRFPLPHFH